MRPHDQSDAGPSPSARRAAPPRSPAIARHVDPDPHVTVQEILSAAADGEQHDEIALRAAERHADRCDECGAFRAIAGGARPSDELGRRDIGQRQIGVGEGATGEPPARATVFHPPPVALRIALWVAAVVNVAAGIPLLLRFDDVGLRGADPSHLTRDGALAVMLGVVAGVVARQPRRARALSMVVIAIVALNVLGGSADVARGAVTPGFESIHLVNGITAALVLACAWVTKPSVRVR